MDHPAKPDFLDDTGRPLAAHIQRVLRDLAPRLLRRFPALKDPAVITDVSRGSGPPHFRSRIAIGSHREAARLRLGDGPQCRDVEAAR